MSQLNKEKLRAEVRSLLEPFRDVIEGAEADVQTFFERAAQAITNVIAIGDVETAQEVVGGLGALAWSTSVTIKRAHAEAFRRSIFLAIRTAIAVLASLPTKGGI